MRKFLTALGMIGVCATGVAARQSASARPAAPAVAVNRFFEGWTTPFGMPPFELIKVEYFMPAFERAIAERRREVAPQLAALRDDVALDARLEEALRPCFPLERVRAGAWSGGFRDACVRNGALGPPAMAAGRGARG